MAIDLTGLSATQTGNLRSRATDEQQPSGTRRGEGEAQPAVSEGPTSADRVSISDVAQAVQNATQEIEAEPDINSDRVAELKAAIDSGTYQVDTDRVAQGMLALDALLD